VELTNQRRLLAYPEPHSENDSTDVQQHFTYQMTMTIDVVAVVRWHALRRRDSSHPFRSKE